MTGTKTKTLDGGRVILDVVFVIAVAVVVKLSRFRTWGKGWQRDDDDGERGRHVFVINVDVDAVNSDPSYRASSLTRTWQWGKRAIALILWRHVRGWHWQGGEKEKGRGLLVLEGEGPNNQHEVRGEGGRREIDNNDDCGRGDAVWAKMGGKG